MKKWRRLLTCLLVACLVVPFLPGLFAEAAMGGTKVQHEWWVSMNADGAEEVHANVGTAGDSGSGTWGVGFGIGNRCLLVSGTCGKPGADGYGIRGTETYSLGSFPKGTILKFGATSYNNCTTQSSGRRDIKATINGQEVEKNHYVRGGSMIGKENTYVVTETGDVSVTVTIGQANKKHVGDQGVGFFIENMQIIRPFTISVVDYCNYGTPHELGSDSYEGVYQSSWSGDQYADCTSTGVVHRGVGDLISRSGYTGYTYVGSKVKDASSTSDTASAKLEVGGEVVFERYFEPVHYTVNIHENIPKSATYGQSDGGNAKGALKSAGTSKGSSAGRPGMSGDYRGSYWSLDFIYDHSTLKKPSTYLSDITGWSMDGDTYGTGSTSGVDSRFVEGATNLTTTDGTVFDLYPQRSKNDYTLTYNTNLSYGSSSMGGGSTSRTEMYGWTEKRSAYTVEGVRIEHNQNNNGGSLNAIVHGKTKKIDMDTNYGDLYAPRAYWTVDIYPHGTKGYTVQNGTMSGHTDKGQYLTHNVESTFVDWYRQKASAIVGGWGVDTGMTNYPNNSYILVRRNIKNIIPANHTIYATWENNSIKLGAPERKYKVTYIKNGGSFTDDSIEDGNSSYQTDYGWDFKGWYYTECEACDGTDNKVCPEHTTQSPANNGVDSFTPTSQVKVYAHWEDPGLKLPEIKKPGYEFIGWYTHQQGTGGIHAPNNPDGSYSDPGLKYGGGEDWNYDDPSDYRVTGDLTLYAWYNRAPVFVDIYEGLFFEGQHVSYSDLLELVGVFDFEDNYQEKAEEVIMSHFDGLIQKNDDDINDVYDKIDHLEAEKDLWIYKDDITHEEHLRDEYTDKMDELREQVSNLLAEKEQIEVERTKALEEVGHKVRYLDVRIAQIDYFKINKRVVNDDGTKTGVVYSEEYRWQDSDTNPAHIASCGIPLARTDIDYNTTYLNTKTSDIGRFDVVYQVHDSGITYVDPVDGQKKLIPNSDITLEYTRPCQINFNYNPIIYAQNLIWDVTSGGSLSEMLLGQQAVVDSEDRENNVPWWHSGKYHDESTGHYRDPVTADEDTSGMCFNPDNENTLPELNDSMVVTGITNFTFTSAFENQDGASEAIADFLSKYDSPEGDSKGGTAIGKYWHNPDQVGEELGGMKDIYKKDSLLDQLQGISTSGEEFGNGFSGADVWNNISSFDVTFDAVDQWGKYASNGVDRSAYEDWGIDTDKDPMGDIPPFNGGRDPDPENPYDPENPGDPDDPNRPDYPLDVYQPEPDRTIKIIIINKELDLEVRPANVSDQVRFIGDQYLNEEKFSKTWWGSLENSERLREVMDTDSKTVQDRYKGFREGDAYKDTLGVEVNDYTDN